MTDQLRVRLLSQRGVRPTVARCMGFEFEDRAAALLGADIVAPTHRRASERREKTIKGVAKRWAPAARIAPGYRQHRDDDHIDLMIMHCQFPGDALLLHAIPRWRHRTAKAVVFVEELWCASMDSWGGTLRLLEEFDQVYVGISRSAAQLAERLDTAVAYLPYSVDTTRFAPRDVDAERPIDVLTIGRRSAVTHAALLEWSIREDRFYHFDSFTPKRCHDPVEHRIMYSRLHQRAAFAIANRGSGAATAGNVGEEALPARYFETAAAGGVLVGQPPSIPELDEEFGWVDAIFPAPFDDDDMPMRLHELAADPARISRVRRRNIAETMRRHDTAHRLGRMLSDVSVPTPEALDAAIEDRISTGDTISPRPAP